MSENKTLNRLAGESEGWEETETEFRIENATYKNNVIQQIMFNHLERTNFLGITVNLKIKENISILIYACLKYLNYFLFQGNVSFTNIGIRRVNRLRVFQYRYGENNSFSTVEFASVPALGNYTTLEYYSGESDSTIWPCN